MYVYIQWSYDINWYLQTTPITACFFFFRTCVSSLITLDLLGQGLGTRTMTMMGRVENSDVDLDGAKMSTGLSTYVKKLWPIKTLWTYSVYHGVLVCCLLILLFIWWRIQLSNLLSKTVHQLPSEHPGKASASRSSNHLGLFGSFRYIGISWCINV